VKITACIGTVLFALSNAAHAFPATISGDTIREFLFYSTSCPLFIFAEYLFKLSWSFLSIPRSPQNTDLMCSLPLGVPPERDMDLVEVILAYLLHERI
jgi:hypothetical protein